MVVWLGEGSHNVGLVGCVQSQCWFGWMSAVIMVVWLSECSHTVGLVG